MHSWNRTVWYGLCRKISRRLLFARVWSSRSPAVYSIPSARRRQLSVPAPCFRRSNSFASRIYFLSDQQSGIHCQRWFAGSIAVDYEHFHQHRHILTWCQRKKLQEHVTKSKHHVCCQRQKFLQNKIMSSSQRRTTRRRIFGWNSLEITDR